MNKRDQNTKERMSYNSDDGITINKRGANKEMTKEQRNKYNSKCKDSFNTKLKMYLFDCVIHGKKDIFNRDEFEKFEITPVLKKIYVSRYYQYDPKDKIKDICSDIDKTIIPDLTINDVYNKIKSYENSEQVKELENDYVEFFKENFPEEKFVDRLNETECYYCGLTLERIDELVEKDMKFSKHDTRGWSLEIDRFDSNDEYRYETTVSCCYFCNNSKSDEFTPEEFKKVGEVYKQIWEDRLRK